MQILGKVYFVGHTTRAGAAIFFLFVTLAFVMKWELNKMAYAGQGWVVARDKWAYACVCVSE